MSKVSISSLLHLKPKGHILSPAAETLPIVRAHWEGMGRTVRAVSLAADTDDVNVLEWLDPEAKTLATSRRVV